MDDNKLEELEQKIRDLENRLNWAYGQIEGLDRRLQKLQIYVDQIS
ncbi:hypothetical protein [Zunongwangia profunda]|jgi:chaperonin cofactor prefoldin|nr:hypothetical protein [Zunongwangia profunda]|tara:strand:- start:11546 stop:11683 length:138 start_codon:yes stop_codon:yes gene_type:complete